MSFSDNKTDDIGDDRLHTNRPNGSNTTPSELDLPSELGTGADTPIINFDDWAEEEDPFANNPDINSNDVFAPLDANQDRNNNNDDVGYGANASSVQNETSTHHSSMMVAGSAALESFPTPLPTRHLLPPVGVPAPLPTADFNRKRNAPEDSLPSSSSNHGSAAGSSWDNRSGSGFSRRKKKPKGMPKRPLSAYNLYFQAQRTKIITERQSRRDDSRGIGFEELGKIVGRQWRELSNAEKKVYEKLAEKDGERYRMEMVAYHEMKNKQYEEEANRPLTAATSPMVAAIVSDLSNTYVPPEFSPHYPRHVSSDSPTGLQHGQTAGVGFGSMSERGAPAPSATLLHDGMDAAPSSSMAHPTPTQSPRRVVSHGVPSPPVVTHLHASQQGQRSMRGPTAAPSLMSFGGSDANDISNRFPLPPGMEILLSDSNGVDRKYRVHYQCFSMTREAAHQYIESLTGAATNHGGNAGSQPRSMPETSAHRPPTAQAPYQAVSQASMPQQHYDGVWGV